MVHPIFFIHECIRDQLQRFGAKGILVRKKKPRALPPTPIHETLNRTILDIPNIESRNVCFMKLGFFMLKNVHCIFMVQGASMDLLSLKPNSPPFFFFVFLRHWSTPVLTKFGPTLKWCFLRYVHLQFLSKTLSSILTT